VIRPRAQATSALACIASAPSWLRAQSAKRCSPSGRPQTANGCRSNSGLIAYSTSGEVRVIDPAAGSESGRIGNLNPQSALKKK